MPEQGREVARLTVVCREPSHGGRDWVVAHLVLRQNPNDGPSGRAIWFEDEEWLNDERPRVKLSGDEPWTHSGFFIGDGSNDTPVNRLRWDFRCDLCGLSVARHDDVVRPILDRLAEAGWPEVTLAGLAATMR